MLKKLFGKINKKNRGYKMTWDERMENDIRARARRYQNLTLEQRVLLERW